MAIPNEQLRQISQDLQKRFANDRYISISPLGEDPPERYEITYNILGVVIDDKGVISESKDHSILINIPFGFPHFPPNCRPETSIFHPDFDQAAICIGDFWDKDKTLPDLIIHIGRMISGEIYSTDNAFNESAVTWYRNNQDRLPFEILTFAPEIEHDLNEEPLTEEFIGDRQIDTLDEFDIDSRPDYLSLEKEEQIEEPSFPATSQKTGKSTLNRIHLMLKQKRYVELSTLLSTLSEDEHFEDREEIENDVEEVLRKANKLQRQADEEEHQGNPQEALELLEQITYLVADFPNINENINRTKKSVALVDGWSDETPMPQGTGMDSDGEEGTGDKKRRVAFFEEKSKASIKIIPIIGAVLALVLIVIFIIPYLRAGSQLNKSEAALQQCTSQLSQDQFKPAQASCKTALSYLQGIHFFKKDDRIELQNKIEQTLASEKMVQGITGRIFFQGKYVKKSDMDLVLTFNKLKEEGDKLLKEEKWDLAAEKYASALSTANPILDSFDDKIILEIRNNNTIAQINILMKKGSTFLANNDIDKAGESYNNALTLAQTLSGEQIDKYISQIEPKISEIEYLQLLDLGKTAFYSNDWEKAIQQYEKALRIRNESDLKNDKGDVESLYANMAEAELYSLISSGKKAFSNSEWDKAIEEYQKAISLLKEKSKLLERINPPEIQKQLQRIILRARIVQHKGDADTKLKENHYKEAVIAFESVIEVINSSNFSKDKEFSSILAGTRNSIAEARKSADIAEKQAYLITNFKKIFEDNYSAAVPDYLSEPKATFIKYIDNSKQLFELQCIERQRGRQLRLVMFYLYDPAKGAWQFYSKKD